VRIKRVTALSNELLVATGKKRAKISEEEEGSPSYTIVAGLKVRPFYNVVSSVLFSSEVQDSVF
jgi:hypothetical protein